MLLRLDTLREAALDALALLLPVECAGCGLPDRAVCADCRAALRPETSSRRLPDGTPVFSGLDYDGVVRAVILTFKEQGRPELARVLAPALAAAVIEAGAAVDLGGAEVVAVPGSRRARRRRGFDPVAALVSRAGLDRARVFAPARPHTAQKTLSSDERARNLDGVFEVAVEVAGRRVLLVDDVVTTGATLAAAAAALRSAGAEVMAAAVVASTPKLYGPSVSAPRERPAAFP
ncbi:MAG TPA: phosphoribosyltransferase family protein [Pseudolysinimonas sp.]|nr:phosphoribosyltransferase family protein [Pseudolysinimonas sp.]